MTASIRQSMNLQDWAMLIALSVLWGGSFFFVGIAVKALTPFTIVLIRLSGAAVTLWFVMMLLKVSPPVSFKTWVSLLIMGILNNVIPFTLIVWGQSHIESGLASIFNAMTPLFTVLVAGTALAYIFFFRILASAGATNVSLVTFLVPVSAIMLGFVFLGERLQLTHIFGMTLIALGLAAIDGRLWQKLKKS